MTATPNSPLDPATYMDKIHGPDNWHLHQNPDGSVVFHSHSYCGDKRIAELEAENERLRDDYESACVTVAQMHKAAVGETRGPDRGVVEDVEDLRAEVERLKGIITKLCSRPRTVEAMRIIAEQALNPEPKS